MNLFKKLYSAAKDAMVELAREKKLKASYKSYLARIEEEIVNLESVIEARIQNTGWTFAQIADTFEDLEIKKEDLKLARQCYEYIFTETKEK